MPPPKGPKRKEADPADSGLTRIAIVNNDRCKPKRCRQECKKSCPVVRMGKLCIEVTPNDKIAHFSEELCIGCGICVKKCPFEAVTIINLPSNLSRETTHRYSANSFKLHRLPVPRPGCVLGLVGTNGIGKSTALKILAGKYNFEDPFLYLLTSFHHMDLMLLVFLQKFIKVSFFNFQRMMNIQCIKIVLLNQQLSKS